MVRHSKNRDGRLVIYNEREGQFRAESAALFLIKRGSKTIAEVRRPPAHFSVTDENEKLGVGVPVSSTRVIRIEIRRNLEAAINKVAQVGDTFHDIARSLRNAAAPRRKGGDERH